MKDASQDFPSRAKASLADEQLQSALKKIPTGFVARRAIARDNFPGFDALRDDCAEIRKHTLENLDAYLVEFESQAIAAGSKVHWAATATDACTAIAEICHAEGARTISKGKSMVSEEIGLNTQLQAQGFKVVETDLGEYILQLRAETPSHIIAPAIHLTQDEIEADFRAQHTHLNPDRDLAAPEELVAEARTILRQEFLAADVGITGANFLVAETGSSIIVTNEGNGDLTQSLPRVHIVLATIEKIVPTLNEATTLLRLLARSATGQDCTTYTTLTTGPRRTSDLDGPTKCHIVVLDGGRSEVLGSELQDILRCIKCGACMNHCPVYGAVGGHPYGWVYPGPMGSILNPALNKTAASHQLAHSSTLCGQCADVCPVKIPLPDLLRRVRQRTVEQKTTPLLERLAHKAWTSLALRPWAYRITMTLIARLLASTRVRHSLPQRMQLGLSGSQTKTFQQLWAERTPDAPQKQPRNPAGQA